MRRAEVPNHEAVAFWSSRAGRFVTPENARAITENLTGFFTLLREWQVEETESASSMTGEADEAGGPK